MLFLSFAVTSETDNLNNDLFSFENDFYDDIWLNGNRLRKILCKPKSARKQFSIFKKFIKNKLKS